MDAAETKQTERFSNLSAWRERLGPLPAIPGGQVLGAAAALALLVAVLVSTALWVHQPAYRPLYAGLADKEAGQVMEALQAQKIPFRIDETTGSIEVPTDQVHAARLKLATQGLPQSAAGGLELLAQPQGLGVSQFMESARYQHALEVELARSIASLQPVQEARVHLALPKASAFVRDQKKPSASVIVQLYPGRNLEPGQVAAINHLIAASIPGMESSQVMVVDQRGNLLTRGQDGAKSPVGVSEDQFSYARRLEQDYANRIETLLMPIVGPGRVRAQVSADMDFTVVEQTQERFDPASQVLRSEQTSEERRIAGMAPGGIPGALSNQPPGAVQLGAAVPAQAQSPKASTVTSEGTPPAAGITDAATLPPPQDISRQSTRNYEIDKTVSRISQPVGTIRRLSVAVLVDDWEQVSAEGASIKTPLNDAELARLTAVVKEAVGFNAARGDSINVVNQAFKVMDFADTSENNPWWARPGLMDAIEKGFVMLMMLVVLIMVVRPLLRRLQPGAMQSIQVMSPPALPRGMNENSLAEDRLSLDGGMARSQANAGTTYLPYETRLVTARTLAAQSPERVAHVMRDWMGNDG
jgi:flagellar M-ring protein FliF